MSGLSIEQILDECREEITTFEFEKGASADPISSVSSDEEVDRMVDLLKEAAVPEVIETVSPPPVESNIYEKVAEAAILNSVLQTIDEEGIKLAEFRETALSSGHDPSEVEALVEKQAKASSLGRLFRSPAAKKALVGAAGVATVGGVGAGSYHAGKEKEKETTKVVGKAAFSAGRKYQYARRRAVESRRQRLREYLMRLRRQRTSQGK